jgi:hypothetical protein
MSEGVVHSGNMGKADHIGPLTDDGLGTVAGVLTAGLSHDGELRAVAGLEAMPAAAGRLDDAVDDFSAGRAVRRLMGGD